MFPKKIKACILFLLLTVPAALGAVWCAKHAYRYHLAVHPLPYSPEQGALLEKHRQDKRNARLNPHAPVLFLGSSTMEFQALQAGHCPIHLDDSYPHSLQKNAVVLAFAMIASSYL